MADLKTNYVDDVLDTSVNEKRKYNMIQNADGTVSFVDVTTYTQNGDSFGAKDVNDTNTAVNELNNNLTADDLQFKFGKDGDGNYGYYGADGSLIPFNSTKKVNMNSLGNKELFLGFKANFVFIFWESKPTICAFYLRNKSSNTAYFIENNSMNARTISASNCPINSITDDSIVLHAWASDQLTEWSILAV